MSESQYFRQEIKNHPVEPEYLNDLRILRRFIQGGSFGYRQFTDDVVFQRLKSRYPKAYSAFGEERRQEVLERYSYSPYIAKVEALPESEYKNKWLKDLRELRKIMILFIARLRWLHYEDDLRQAEEQAPRSFRSFQDRVRRVVNL